MIKIKNVSLEFVIIIFLVLTGIIYSQENSKIVEKTGKIGFQSSQNIYINFENTEGISVGDTLFIKQKNKLIPAIIVKYLSGTSCAGKSTDRINLKGDETVIALVAEKKIDKKDNTEIKPFAVDTLALQENNNITEVVSTPQIKIVENKKYVPENSYSGRFSVQSISSLTNTGSSNDLQRWRYSFLYNKSEFLDPKLSFSSYIIFAYSANQWSQVTSNINNNLKIYNFTLSYKPDEKTTFWFGRHLNNKVGNIGATDGLQVERQLGDFYAGVIIGSRPSYIDYSYNIKLFEYGGYFGRTDKVKGTYMENVVGAFQQTNNMKTDRRFLYFQHSNNLNTQDQFFLFNRS